jgi:hypothetical protein
MLFFFNSSSTTLTLLYSIIAFFIVLDMKREYSLIISFLFFSLSIAGQLENGLLIHYPLNGDYQDASPNGYDGIPIDVQFIDDQYGNPNSAIELDGLPSRVEFPNIPELEIDFPMSFSVRANFYEIIDQEIVFATDYSETTHSGAWLQMTSVGQIAAAYGNAAGGFNTASRHGKSTTIDVEENTWYNLIVIIRGFEDIDIYLDCELLDGVYSGTATTIGYTDGPGNLGRKCANPISLLPPHHIDGAIDDFWFWERELTEEEIFSLCSVDCQGELNTVDNSSCTGQAVVYSFDLQDEEGSIASYFWEFGNGTTSNLSQPTVAYDNPGDFDFDLSIVTNEGCIYQSSGTTTILNSPPPPTVESDFELCQGESFILLAADYPEWEVSDEFGNSLDEFELTEAGVYEFNFESECGLETVEITVFVIDFQPGPLPQVSNICEGQDTATIGFMNKNYFFDWDNGAISPTIDVAKTGTYEVLVTDSTGQCSRSYSFQVLLTPPHSGSIFDAPEIQFCSEGENILSFPNQFAPYFLSTEDRS